MGFEVCEYCIWDPKKRRMDSNVILKVAEVRPPPQPRTFPQT